MPPYTLLRSTIVQRCCSHSVDPWPGLFLFSFFFVSLVGSPSSFSSFLAPVFKSLLAWLGYVIVEV